VIQLYNILLIPGIWVVFAQLAIEKFDDIFKVKVDQNMS
jgi:hypothetical protein